MGNVSNSCPTSRCNVWETSNCRQTRPHTTNKKHSIPTKTKPNKPPTTKQTPAHAECIRQSMSLFLSSATESSFSTADDAKHKTSEGASHAMTNLDTAKLSIMLSVGTRERHWDHKYMGGSRRASDCKTSPTQKESANEVPEASTSRQNCKSR